MLYSVCLGDLHSKLMFIQPGRGFIKHVNFCRASMKTGNILLSLRNSLETFIKICQHPVFSPFIRKSQSSCTRLHKDTSVEVVESMLDDYEDEHDFVHIIQKLPE